MTMTLNNQLNRQPEHVVELNKFNIIYIYIYENMYESIYSRAVRTVNTL